MRKLENAIWNIYGATALYAIGYLLVSWVFGKSIYWLENVKIICAILIFEIVCANIAHAWWYIVGIVCGIIVRIRYKYCFGLTQQQRITMQRVYQKSYMLNRGIIRTIIDIAIYYGRLKSNVNE